MGAGNPDLALGRGLTRGPGATPIELVVTELNARQGVLLIDNCEQVAGAVGERAEQILQRCAQMRVLATSRAPLGVSGEATWIVPALSMDDSAARADNDAASLFLIRARSAVGELSPSDADMQLVHAICRELEGVPLAIELAAAHLRTASLQEVHDRLADRLAILVGGSTLSVPRQRAVRASIDWSHALLAEREQVLFRRLAVFAGGWDVEAMRAVCAGHGLDAHELPGLLDQLVLNSVVHANRDGAATRYTMLDVVREYARERLADSGEAAVAADRHVARYVALARRADYEY